MSGLPNPLASGSVQIGPGVGPVFGETDYQQRPNFIKYLMDGPSFESVDLERYPSLMRNMDL